MEWLSKNTEPDAVIASWWDYGYWITTLGNRPTSQTMQPSTIHDPIDSKDVHFGRTVSNEDSTRLES